MPFRGRKSIPIIPYVLKYNFAVSAGKKKGVSTSGSWTMGILGVATYNTRDGRYRVNTPGWGWWESSTRAQRRKRKAEKRVANTQARPAVAAAGNRPASDPDAGAFARYFKAIRKEERDPRAEARAYGRCPDCGHLLPESRGGEAACPKCIQTAQRARERAEAAADDVVRVQREAGAPVKPRRAPTSPPLAPQNAHGQELPTGASGWPGGVEAWVEQQNAESARNREERQERARSAGLCGAPTTKDRSPCLNYAGSCPHHSGARL